MNGKEIPTLEQLQALPEHTMVGVVSRSEEVFWVLMGGDRWYPVAFGVGDVDSLASADLLKLYDGQNMWVESVPTVLMDGFYVSGYTAALDKATEKIEDLMDKQEKDEYGTYVEGYEDALNDAIVALEDDDT